MLDDTLMSTTQEGWWPNWKTSDLRGVHLLGLLIIRVGLCWCQRPVLMSALAESLGEWRSGSFVRWPEPGYDSGSDNHQMYLTLVIVFLGQPCHCFSSQGEELFYIQGPLIFSWFPLTVGCPFTVMRKEESEQQAICIFSVTANETKVSRFSWPLTKEDDLIPKYGRWGWNP